MKVLLASSKEVTLHTEGVDRNYVSSGDVYLEGEVTLHTEGVDRNLPILQGGTLTLVTLHTEGVDRNWKPYEWTEKNVESPSTRRVWIEMAPVLWSQVIPSVTLHTEGVDRNACINYSIFVACVTLHTEGVDRNLLRIRS